ncbi:hypothetical protein FRB99_007151 [Tulasnella sp. 403]|nr:hypothetical protein FRB99_007151 [Tulasnella sp. 403]
MPSVISSPAQVAMQPPRHRSKLPSVTDHDSSRAATPLTTSHPRAKGKERESSPPGNALPSRSSKNNWNDSQPFKRKSPGDTTDPGHSVNDTTKRPRLSAEAVPSPHMRHSPNSVASSSNVNLRTPNAGTSRTYTPSAKKEEGELDESPVRPLSSISADSTRPPRARRTLPDDQISAMYEPFTKKARDLKRSGERRRESGSSISTRNLYGTLEQTDAVLHFAYAFWAYGVTKSSVSAWESFEGLINQCRQCWEKVFRETDADSRGKIKVFIGLLDLIRFCMRYHIHKHYISKLKQASDASSAASPGNASSASPPGSYHPTPPPPYTSTVQGVHPNAAPSPASSSSSGGHQPSRAPAQPGAVSQSPQHSANSAPFVSVPADVVTLQNKLLQATQQLATTSNYSADLNLYNLRQWFPRTHAVCAGDNASTGQPLVPGKKDDRLQVDLEACVRGDGEWAWPITSGDDVAHAVGFGRSLLWEYGLELGGYRGSDGVWKNEDGSTFH